MIIQSCTICARNPEVKNEWGCIEPKPTPVRRMEDEMGNIFEYYSCPLLFINKTCREFEKKYFNIKSNLSQLEIYENQNCLFNYMSNIFEFWLNRFNKMKSDK